MQKIRRIVALLSVFFIIVLIIATIICAITGSKYFFAVFFLMLAVPVVLWVFMWFTRLVNGDSDVIPKEKTESKEHLKRGTEPDRSDSEK